MLMSDDIELIKCLIKQQQLEMQREQLNNVVEKSGGTFDVVTGPAHYLEGREYEPRKVIEDWDLGFYLGNTVKYIARAGRKNDMLEDLKRLGSIWIGKSKKLKRKGARKNHEKCRVV